MKHNFLDTLWPLLLTNRDNDFRLEFGREEVPLFDFCKKAVDPEETGIDEDSDFFELSFSKDEVDRAKEIWDQAETEDLPRMASDPTYIYQSSTASDYKFLLKLATYLCLQE